MTKHSFKINVEKSAIICKDGITITSNSTDAAAPTISIADPSKPFKMLGGIINDVYTEVHEMIRGRIDRFFDSLDELSVHPEVKHTIMYFSGNPKLVYFAATTPPEHARCIVEHFDRRCKLSFARLIDADVASISNELLHADEGAGIPNYVEHHAAIYANSRAAALVGTPNQRVKLTSSSAITSHVEAEYDSQWLRYVHPTLSRQLQPSLYATALAMRVLKIPRFIHDPRVPKRCNCGALAISEPEIIAHALTCEKFSRITPGARHTFLKASIRGVASAHGIPSSNEPNFYEYEEPAQTRQQPLNNVTCNTTNRTIRDAAAASSSSHVTIAKQRPDATFYLSSGYTIVTDYTIVTPDSNAHGSRPGAAAARAADEKRRTHHAAAAAAGHEFIPFAAETTGHFDSSVYKFVNKIAQFAAPVHQHPLRRDILGAASTALAQYRALAVVNACHEQLALGRYA